MEKVQEWPWRLWQIEQCLNMDMELDLRSNLKCRHWNVRYHSPTPQPTLELGGYALSLHS